MEELEFMTDLYSELVAYLVEYGFQLLAAVVILIVGIIIARKVSDGVFNLCQKKNLDVTLSRFFASCVKIFIVLATLVVVLPKIGIQITPFVAAIGAIGLGAGLAVQGLLSNYSAGLAIVITRPFVVGDTIKVQGVAGVVKEVNLAHTILGNEDNERITIPNRHIIGEIIHNSQQDSAVELMVGIAYSSDPQQAVEVIAASLRGLEGLSDAREPQVGIHQFGDSSIDIGVRIWVKTEQLFETRYRANMAVFKALEDNGVVIPFPQREVRMLGQQQVPQQA